MSRSTHAPYKPRWKGPVEGFVVNFAKQHAWRVQPAMDETDLYQEAWMIFNKCAHKYTDVEACHFMALFKTAVWRRVTTLSNIRTHRKETSLPDDQAQQEVICDLLQDAEIRMMLEDAPDIIKTLVNKMGHCGIKDSVEARVAELAGHEHRASVTDLVKTLVSDLESKYRVRRGVRETTVDLITRLTGKKCDSALIKSIKNWVQGENTQFAGV